ncbi:hypothetical protein B0H10DRAFT_2218120 [Mycena sp. CBHHK59/15]|nr:hypothetical protein B0H10DRAFT_2218120 [Mycena sp. CBHHK59/15]
MSRAVPPHLAGTLTNIQHEAASTASRKPSPKMVRKGLQYLQKTAPVVKPEERVRITARRMLKAERDERMDITSALTPIYGWFHSSHRSADLKLVSWRFLSRTGQSVRNPSLEAYESHTVFLLESRYNVRYGVGRVESPDYIYGVCREQDFPDVLKHYNSGKAPRQVLEVMDNARWPWGRQIAPHKRVQWWIDDDDRNQALQEIGFAVTPKPDTELLEEDDEDGEQRSAELGKTIRSPKKKKVKRVTALSPISSRPTSASSPGQPPGDFVSPSFVRTFHSSSVLLAGQGYRGFHTSTSVRATEAEWDFARAQASQPRQAFVPREEYLPTLDETPFWRPLLTFTVSTRPIALTLLRLSKGQNRGRPFHADVSNDDKKCRVSFPYRMRAMRIKRMQDLAIEMAQVLAGARGGVVGLRFDPDCMGRGIGGEGLENPVPHEKRVIRVGVGNWFRFASDVRDVFRARGKEEVPHASDGGAIFDLYGLDDFGHRISEQTGEVIPWRTRQETPADTLRREEWYDEYRVLRSIIKSFDRPYPLLMKKKAAEKEAESEASASGGSTPVSTGGDRKEIPAGAPAPDLTGEDDAEIELREDDDGEVPLYDPYEPLSGGATEVSKPTVYVHEGNWRLDGNVKDGTVYDTLLREGLRPLDFAVVLPNGRPVIGPRDPKTGEISMAGLTEQLKPNQGKYIMQRRVDLICLVKYRELGIVGAATHSKVEYIA